MGSSHASTAVIAEKYVTFGLALPGAQRKRIFLYVDLSIFPRIQMGLSLAFHIIFASIGMTMPVLMALAEWRAWKHKDPVAKELNRAWAKGTAVFFAIGAVSGTVLAFELGLLFPKFMLKAGPTIGLPFALEGFAFFTESIFLGIYLYGESKVSPSFHFLSGIVVAVSGLLSAIFVTCANAWMNTPGKDHPLAPFLSPALWHELPHSILACFVAVGLAVAAIHARELLEKPHSTFHRLALRYALIVALPGMLLQPFIGHLAGQRVYQLQPQKFAAIENLTVTEKGGLISFLATNKWDSELKGLDQFPESPSPLVRPAFLLMIASGIFLFAFSLLLIFRWEKFDRSLLKAIMFSGPLGFLALESGWMVTEIGRQPWIIQGVMKTSEAIVAQPGLSLRPFFFAGLYLVLGIATLQILRSYVRNE